MKNTKYLSVNLSQGNRAVTTPGDCTAYFGGETDKDSPTACHLAMYVGGPTGELMIGARCGRPVPGEDRRQIQTPDGVLTGTQFPVRECTGSIFTLSVSKPKFIIFVDIPCGAKTSDGDPISLVYVLVDSEGNESLTVCLGVPVELKDTPSPQKETTSKPVDSRPLAKVIQFPGNRVVH